MLRITRHIKGQTSVNLSKEIKEMQRTYTMLFLLFLLEEATKDEHGA